MKPRVPYIKAARGFTLLELTIAMSLLLLVVLILYGSFYVAHRAVAKAEVRAEESQRLRSFVELLGVYVRSAYPYRLSARERGIFFLGEEGGLTFVSALSTGIGGRGMAKVSLAEDDQREGVLVLEEEIPVRLGAEDHGGGYRNRVVLRHGVRGVAVEYLDPRSETELWTGQWDGRQTGVLPRAVRLKFREGRGAEVQWVFPIMMSVLAP